MKKLALILLSIIIIGGKYYYKQETLTRLDNDIYIKDNRIYSVLTDKLISGYTTSTSWGNIEYTKYKKGIMISKKKVGKDLRLLSEEKFNKKGLLDGERFEHLGNKIFIFKYKNNILNGKSNLNNKEIEFVDGTIVGKNSISEYENPYNINYKNGVPDFIKLDIPSNKYPEEIFYNTKLMPNFTGGIFKKINWDMVLSEYQNGELIRERFYIADSNMIGLKKKDIIYGKNKKIRKELIYKSGILKELNSYNDKMEKTGQSYKNIQYYGESFVQNYKKGFLNGNSIQYVFDKDKKLNKYFGFYKLGIYTGEKYSCQYVGKYLKGFNIDQLNDSIKFKPFIIEDLTEVPKNFNGYNRNKNKIFEYKAGEIKKEYNFIDSIYQKVKIYNKDGSYKENTYQDGLIVEVINYDNNNIRNGEYIGYVHNELKEKTIGMIIDNIYTGEFKHYHGDEIIYIDIYNGNTECTRIHYYNYKEKKIKSISKRVFKNGYWEQIAITDYDGNGNVINDSKNLENNNKLKKYDKLLFENIKRIN